MASGGGGQFWYGEYGFLYKKKAGGGARKNPRYGLICNQPQNVFNKYKPGGNGIGALNKSVKRAQTRLATICNENQRCGNFYPRLGLHPNSSHIPVSDTYPNITVQQFNSAQYISPLVNKNTFANLILNNY